MRERERVFREEERRRREDMEREYMKREIDRRHRDEAARLEREREKLRREKEWIEQKRLEQKRAELLHLERERQKIEREKLEREKLELKRQQLRLEESRRAPPPPSIKRSSSDRRDPRDLYVEPERKRLAADDTRRHSPDRVPGRRAEILDRVSDRRMETSPLPRYESSRSILPFPKSLSTHLSCNPKHGTFFMWKSSFHHLALTIVTRQCCFLSKQ